MLLIHYSLFTFHFPPYPERFMKLHTPPVGADRIRPQHKAPLRGAYVPGRLLVDPYRAYALILVLPEIRGYGRILSAPTVHTGSWFHSLYCPYPGTGRVDYWSTPTGRMERRGYYFTFRFPNAIHPIIARKAAATSIHTVSIPVPFG